MPLLKTAAKVGATVCSNLLVLSVCPWDRLPFCLYPPVRHTGNTLEDNKVQSVKMKRVRDKAKRGGGERREWVKEQRRDWRAKWQRAEKNRMGGERLWKCCSFPLRSHYLQKHAVKALPLHPHTDICRRDSGISPACKFLPNAVINCFRS